LRIRIIKVRNIAFSLCEYAREILTIRNMKIGDVIRKRRKALGLTLEGLALAAQSDGGNLSRIERGVQKASTEALELLAGAMGTTVGALYRELERLQADETVPVTDYRLVRLQKLFADLDEPNQVLLIDFASLLKKHQ
jgi:transcriptional regulator with XRE-family HTH domain